MSDFSLKMQNIRNFSIIAHVDHGKSTLADRLIEDCGGLEAREMKEQFLDSMDIERERGITIKAQTVRLNYVALDGQSYILNLIDTPGHVDFSYEVDRSLAACEGSILVVDATQGVEAQTIANVYKSIDNNHEIVPIINKIDLASADPKKVLSQIEEMIGLDTANHVLISAKVGIGIRDVLEAIIKYIPHPKGAEKEKLQALLVDSWYDIYLGIVILVRIKNGILKKDMNIVMHSTGAQYKVDNVGVFTPHKKICESLRAGEVGFFTASIKQISDCNVGDTIMEDGNLSEPLPGFKKLNPVVFCSMFPINADQFTKFRQSLEKLHLNDSSFTFEIESSNTLGHGFRFGFLGVLHLEIIQERLNREFDIDLIVTAPSVLYKVHLKTDEILHIYNPIEMPDPTKIDYIEEPWIKATIMLSNACLGPVLSLCNDKRGEQIDLSHNGSAAILIYYLPLGDVVFDFHDRLKSISKGYASFDWEIADYRTVEVVKLDILINGEPLLPLSCLLYKGHAEKRAREICEHLQQLIPRQQYKIAIQGSIGGKVIARETVNPYRKDVTAKLYGGDRTRRMKLLEKQKRGKKRLFNFGNVEIPQNAFIEVLKLKP